MVSEQFSSENSKFYRGCTAHELFCHSAILQFLMSDISFNIACKELKIAQIAQLNQLFQLLHLAYIYGHCFYTKGSRSSFINKPITSCHTTPSSLNERYFRLSFGYLFPQKSSFTNPDYTLKRLSGNKAKAFQQSPKRNQNLPHGKFSGSQEHDGFSLLRGHKFII